MALRNAFEALGLDSTLQSIRDRLSGLALLTFDSSARLRVVSDSVTITGTVSGVSTVSTVSTVTNQSQMGGIATNDQVPALMMMRADNLRRNIMVT